MSTLDAKPARYAAAALVAVALGLASPLAAAACRASADHAHSFDTHLSPVAGQVCRMTVEVFAGGSCAEPARWQVRLPCDQASHTAISNQGRLISILLPRTKSQELNVIRVTWGTEKFALASVRKLTAATPLRGEVRLDFDGDALRLKANHTLSIPFETVRKLTSVVSD
jgi:hypothetical protein